MIDLDPSARPSFDTILHTSRGSVFPESFYSFLHNYVASVNDLPNSPPFSSASPATAASTPAASTIAPSASSTTIRVASSTGHSTSIADTVSDALPSDSDHRMERIWADYESVVEYIAPNELEDTVMGVKLEYTSSVGASKRFQVSVSLIPWFISSHGSAGYPSC